MTDITQAERSRLIDDALATETLVRSLSGAMSEDDWIWASFCDPERPTGQQFLGVVIAPGNELFPALFIKSLWEAGLNPGGECSFMQIPPEHLPAPEFRLRLLNREEAESL